jgi:NAD(P)-dependent dehydrogenase (short-subunit alcohol dehydrogenase family)
MSTNILVVKNILITGGTSGLGLELVKLFLSEGSEVYVTGRNPKGLPLQNSKLHFIAVDFSDLKAVSEIINKFAGQSIKFDILVNNAGILSPPVYTTTNDSFEYTFQVNFLSHLLIDEMIIRNKTDSAPLTVVSVTSPVYKYVKPDFRMSDINRYRSFKVYAESKLYLLLIGEYLCSKYPEKRLRFIGYDPGTFSSGIYRMQKKWFQVLYKIAAPFMRSPAKVAKALYQILTNQIRNYDLVYDVSMRTRQIPYSNTAEAGELLNFCEQNLARFLS